MVNVPAIFAADRVRRRGNEHRIRILACRTECCRAETRVVVREVRDFLPQKIRRRGESAHPHAIGR